MYEFTSHIRYSEVDCQGELTWLSLMDYFQDCSVAHSESLNRGIKFLAEHNLAWVINAWQIELIGMPKLMEPVRVQTWPYDMKGFFGLRNFVMCAPDGQKYAYANSIWVLVDTQTGRPARIPDEILSAYSYDPKLEMQSNGRKMKVPQEYEQKEEIVVPGYFIDTNMHMNNSKHLQVAQDYLPANFKVKRVQIEYRKSAVLHDVIFPRVTIEPDSVTVVLADQEGNPYSIVKFGAKLDEV